MSLSDSMFLFEIVVEELQSFINYNGYSILTRFADLFNLRLKNPNEFNIDIPKRPRKKSKRKKVRGGKTTTEKAAVERIARVGQSVLVPNNAESLITNMKTYPLQMSLCPKSDPEYVLGSTNIPWSKAFIDYLNDLIKNVDVPPVTIEGTYNVFDEISSKRMATIKMSIRLSCLNDKVTTQFRSLSEDNPQTFVYTSFNSDPTTILSTIKEKEQQTIDFDEPGIIKTIYSGGKKYKRTSSKDKKITSKTNALQPEKEEPKKIQTKINLNRSTEIDENNDLLESKQSINKNIIGLVKSDTDLEVSKQIAVVKSKSYSSLEYESHLNTLNYIFGDRNEPYRNQIYCVGYFTVQKNSGSSGNVTKSSEKSSEPKEKYKFRVCDSECASRKNATSCSLSHCTLDLPADAAPFISITKCNSVKCDSKKHREPPTPPDERIMLDLTSIKQDCCHKTDVTQKVEEVVGGMTATMKMGNDPCYCSCECRFGFTKKTTYCKICGGYELVGDELSRRLAHDMPTPCPIFHKLVDKNKRKSTPSTEKKKRMTAIESEKDSKKGKKKKKDDRFKFNYGYQAPQIGHSQCAIPCTGTLGNVPKRMGWLWTAEDVPGLKKGKGWKPGAISKRLLRKLRSAKLVQYTALKSKRQKKSKKRADNKPTLIICKVNGEYRVEMQVTGKNSEGAVEQYNPLVYKIARADNEERILRMERKRRQLLKKVVEDLWQDPYHPEVCEQTCLKAYKQAVGLIPFDPNKPECNCEVRASSNSSSCSCDDDDLSSVCSSLDVDWEIHFTPPICNS